MPLSAGPYTPWPNRAEAAVRYFKATLFDLCAQIGSSPELKQVTVRELLRKSSAVRSSTVSTGRIGFRETAKKCRNYLKLVS